MATVQACGRHRGWGLSLPLLSTHPHHWMSPKQACPFHLGWEQSPRRRLRGPLLTLAEVGEDVVLPELGSGRTHLGVAIAEAAAAAGGVVVLQVKRARTTSAREAGHAPGGL